MNEKFRKREYPIFRPQLEGCVGRDPRLANEANEALCYFLYAIAANTNRGAICKKIDASSEEVTEMIASDATEHFQIFGDLISALGGQPAVHARIVVESIPVPPEENAAARKHTVKRVLHAAREENRRATDLLQSLMGHTQDRVVRSVLSGILHDLGMHREMLNNTLS